MTIKSDVLKQLDGLIDEGKRLDDSYTMTDMASYESSVPERDLRAYATKAFAAIARIAGKESEFYGMLPEVDYVNGIAVAGYSNTFVPSVLGSLTGLRDAVDNNYLEQLETRVRANIHDDFLQQAKELLDQNYHVAAMVLIGGVLEDHLNKLCVKNGLTWNGNGSISKYNDACRQGNIYNQPIWRRIQSIGDSRNDAAHGQGANVNAPDVQDAFQFTERFIADYPA